MTKNMAISEKIYKARKAIRKRVYDLLLQLEQLTKDDLSKDEKRALHLDIEYHQKYLTEAVFFDSEYLYRDHILWYNEKTPTNEQKKYDLFNIILAFRKLFREWLPDEEFQLINEFIEFGIEALKNKHTYLKKAITDSNPYKNEVKQYVDLLLSNQKYEALDFIFELYNKGVSIIDIYRYVLRGGLREIGYLWQTNKINVAKEHIATNITECVVRDLYAQAHKKPHNNIKVLMATIGSEEHHLGIKMISNVLEINGFETYFLGNTVPPNDLFTMVEEINPEIVLISTTMTFHLNQTYKTIQHIKTHHPKTKIIVGGYAFNVDNTIWRKFGIDAYGENLSDLLIRIAELYPHLSIDSTTKYRGAS